jgi:intracellular sulfur oxidation DsrE/DsrF family protein
MGRERENVACLTTLSAARMRTMAIYERVEVWKSGVMEWIPGHTSITRRKYT